MRIPEISKKYAGKIYGFGACLFIVLMMLGIHLWITNDERTQLSTLGSWLFKGAFVVLIGSIIMDIIYCNFLTVPVNGSGSWWLMKNGEIIAAKPGKRYWGGDRYQLFVLYKSTEMSTVRGQIITQTYARTHRFNWVLKFAQINAAVAEAYLNWYNQMPTEMMDPWAMADFLKESAAKKDLPFQIILAPNN